MVKLNGFRIHGLIAAIIVFAQCAAFHTHAETVINQPVALEQSRSALYELDDNVVVQALEVGDLDETEQFFVRSVPRLLQKLEEAIQKKTPSAQDATKRSIQQSDNDHEIIELGKALHAVSSHLQKRSKGNKALHSLCNACDNAVGRIGAVGGFNAAAMTAITGEPGITCDPGYIRVIIESCCDDLNATICSKINSLESNLESCCSIIEGTISKMTGDTMCQSAVSVKTQTTILAPGYYVLCNDIVGFSPAIEIAARDVMLDLNGHRVIHAAFDPTDVVGIRVQPVNPDDGSAVSNVTIYNGSIERLDLGLGPNGQDPVTPSGVGLDVPSTDPSQYARLITVYDVLFKNWDLGINAVNTTKFTINDCKFCDCGTAAAQFNTVTDIFLMNSIFNSSKGTNGDPASNGFGVNLLNCTNVKAKNCNFNKNVSHGALIQNGCCCEFFQCTAEGGNKDGGDGFRVVSTQPDPQQGAVSLAKDVIFRDCYACSNNVGFHGINANNIFLKDSTAKGNGDGFVMEGDFITGLLQKNVATNNKRTNLMGHGFLGTGKPLLYLNNVACENDINYANITTAPIKGPLTADGADNIDCTKEDIMMGDCCTNIIAALKGAQKTATTVIQELVTAINGCPSQTSADCCTQLVGALNKFTLQTSLDIDAFIAAFKDCAALQAIGEFYCCPELILAIQSYQNEVLINGMQTLIDAIPTLLTIALEPDCCSTVIDALVAMQGTLATKLQELAQSLPPKITIVGTHNCCVQTITALEQLSLFTTQRIQDVLIALDPGSTFIATCPDIPFFIASIRDALSAGMNGIINTLACQPDCCGSTVIDDLITSLTVIEQTQLSIISQLDQCCSKLDSNDQSIISELDQCCSLLDGNDQTIISKLDLLCSKIETIDCQMPCPPIPITGGTTICASGCYCLTQDLVCEDICIKIAHACSVCLDLNGHAVRDVRLKCDGTEAAKQLCIKNGKITRYLTTQKNDKNDLEECESCSFKGCENLSLQLDCLSAQHVRIVNINNVAFTAQGFYDTISILGNNIIAHMNNSLVKSVRICPGSDNVTFKNARIAEKLVAETVYNSVIENIDVGVDLHPDGEIVLKGCTTVAVNHVSAGAIKVINCCDCCVQEGKCFVRGITVENSNGTCVNSCVSYKRKPGAGFSSERSRGTTFENCVACDNQHGFTLLHDTKSNIIRCIAKRNGSNGFIDDECVACTVNECQALGNMAKGFEHKATEAEPIANPTLFLLNYAAGNMTNYVGVVTPPSAPIRLLTDPRMFGDNLAAALP